RHDEGSDDLADELGGHDRLDPQLGDTLLLSHLPDRGVGALAGEERPGARGVPRAALVAADPTRARGERRRARPLERLARREPDELVPPRRGHVCPAGEPGTRAAWRP